MRTAKTRFARVAWTALALVLSACNLAAPKAGIATAVSQAATATAPTSAPASTSAAPAADVSMQEIDSLQPTLDATLQKLKLASPGSTLSWMRAETPFLPNEWPPTASTVWTSYIFAYGHDVAGNLADGQHVAQPWAKIVVDRATGKARLSILGDKIVDSGKIQGVQPLSAETTALLNRGSEVREWSFGLTASPPWPGEGRKTAQMQQYFKSWEGYNGVIRALVEADHAAFFNTWVAVDVN
jgi:hypothetical protein